MLDKLCIKDSLKTDNYLEFSPELEYFLEKNIFRILVDYCCFKNIELIQIIIPYLEKIITGKEKNNAKKLKMKCF